MKNCEFQKPIAIRSTFERNSKFLCVPSMRKLHHEPGAGPCLDFYFTTPCYTTGWLDVEINACSSHSPSWPQPVPLNPRSNSETCHIRSKAMQTKQTLLLKSSHPADPAPFPFELTCLHLSIQRILSTLWRKSTQPHILRATDTTRNELSSLTFIDPNKLISKTGESKSSLGVKREETLLRAEN